MFIFIADEIRRSVDEKLEDAEVMKRLNFLNLVQMIRKGCFNKCFLKVAI